MTKNTVFDSRGIIKDDFLNKEKQIYILSTDISGKNLFFILLQNQVKVSGFAVKGLAGGKLYGLRIISIDEADKENSIYVTDSKQWDFFRGELDEGKVFFIDSQSLNKNKFTFIESGKHRKCNAALMLTMILSRVQKKKAAFLVNSEYVRFWINLVDVLKEEIQDAVIISIDTESEKIYDLMYSDLDDLIVFVCVFEYEKIADMLIKLGLKQTNHFVYIYNSFSGHVTGKYQGFDWYLGNSFLTEQKFPGFYIYGNINADDSQKRIVLLGNSVTDPLFYPQKSWPEMLWENCKKQQTDIIILNGAVTDYNSTNEVIKLFRDVILLKPDIVISYSGAADFRQYVPNYPYVNLNLTRTSSKWEHDNEKKVIYGIEDNRSAYERWLGNEKIMYQICQIQGISFIGVLQPWIGSECRNVWEKLQFWNDNYWQVAFPQFDFDEYIDNAKEFKKRIQEDVKRNDWLYDFTDIYSGIEDSDIYFDFIHVNERGNLIVAEKFYEILKLKKKKENMAGGGV